MAESVKRRVAAARLAVAFVAAGTIAGATAWAQAGPPPIAQSSASDIFAKLGDIKGEYVDSGNIDDGSLLYKDFQKGQIPSFKLFNKLDETFVKFKKATSDFKLDVKGDAAAIKGELSGIKTEVSGIKGELGSYIKSTDADARYLKLSDDVVRGDGSVFTATKEAVGPDPLPILTVPGLISVDAVTGEQEIRITNIGSSGLAFSTCTGQPNGGALLPGGSFKCSASQETEVMQLIGIGSPEAMTLNFTFFPAVQSGKGIYSVQILVGL